MVWANVIHQLLMILLQLLLVALVAWVHSFLPVLRKWLLHHLTQKERAILETVAGEACMLAETAFRQAGGADKLNYAMEYALSVLQNRGIQITPQEVRAAIEQALYGTSKESAQSKQP